MSDKWKTVNEEAGCDAPEPERKRKAGDTTPAKASKKSLTVASRAAGEEEAVLDVDDSRQSGSDEKLAKSGITSRAEFDIFMAKPWGPKKVNGQMLQGPNKHGHFIEWIESGMRMQCRACGGKAVTKKNCVQHFTGAGHMEKEKALVAKGETKKMNFLALEGNNLFQGYKFYFDKYDVGNKGVLSVDDVFAIFEEAQVFEDGRPKIMSIVNLINAFCADNSGQLNVTEFHTMMSYIGEGGEMARCLNEDGGEKAVSSCSIIATAIKMYEESKQLVRDRLVEKLGPINSIISMKGVEFEEDSNQPNPMDTEFDSAYRPNQMRCLALVSQDSMNDTMMKFVMANKNVLKKFCLTGTKSMMTMLRSLFEGDDSVVFGPSCMSGLGGEADLVAMLCREQLGGVILFEDPLDNNSNFGDIKFFNRNIKLNNIMHADTTVSATMMMHTLRQGLEHGKPELLPSFFVSLQCPSVVRYK